MMLKQSDLAVKCPSIATDDCAGLIEIVFNSWKIQDPPMYISSTMEFTVHPDW